MGNTIANTQPKSHKKEPDFEMETQNVYTKWGLPAATKGSFSRSNQHLHRVLHVKKPPPTLSVHSNPTLRERIRAKMSFPYPQFCSRLLSATKPAKTPSLFSFFLFLLKKKNPNFWARSTVNLGTMLSLQGLSAWLWNQASLAVSPLMSIIQCYCYDFCLELES